MIINTSIKALTLLLAVGVTCTSGSNLRRRRAALLGHRGRDDGGGAPPVAAEKQLRGPSAPAVVAAEEDAPNESARVDEESSGDVYVEEEASGDAYVEEESVEAPSSSQSGPLSSDTPSLALDKSTYAEEEPIAATFSVGPLSHPYYSSVDAPSPKADLDFDYPRWSVGLFMRDADPQGGALEPIVRINVCGALRDGCDAGDYARYTELSVTFGSENLGLMEGRWPLEVSEYGTGFDAYVLDGKGAAAIGPLEFSVRGEDDAADGEANGPVYYRPGDEAEAPSSSQANTMIAEANGLEMSSSADETAGPSRDTIASDKFEYDDDESVSIHFALESSEEEDISGYRIGIFMRMAHPQGGTLAPITSLPLCPKGGCAKESDLTTGSVTFSQETMMEMTPPYHWPIDLFQWGTGFDAYVLDQNGGDVVGPVKFNIMMSDTY